METETVRAAGGVVLRDGEDGPEVVLVHRPRYDDWSLPKGKLAAGEGWLAAAVREVREETGLSCRPTAPAGTLRYRDRNGRPKEVRFWQMSAEAGRVDRRPDDGEVDRVEWLPVSEALARLTYGDERDLLAALLPRGPTPGPGH